MIHHTTLATQTKPQTHPTATTTDISHSAASLSLTQLVNTTRII